MVDIRKRIEENLIVKDKEGNIKEKETLEKRKVFQKTLEKEIEKTEFELEEAELRYKLYKKNPKRTQASKDKSNNYIFEEEKEWLDFEFKRLSKSFEDKIDELKERLNDYNSQLKVIKEYTEK